MIPDPVAVAGAGPVECDELRWESSSARSPVGLDPPVGAHGQEGGAASCANPGTAHRVEVGARAGPPPHLVVRLRPTRCANVGA